MSDIQQIFQSKDLTMEILLSKHPELSRMSPNDFCTFYRQMNQSRDFFVGRKDLGNTNADKDWKLLLTFDEIDRYIQKMADYINEKFVGKGIVITCILKGAAFFYVLLCMKLIIPYTCYFIEASSYKDKQTQDEILEILSKIVPSKFVGKTVILIDELFDNGITMANIKNHIHVTCDILLEDIFTCALFFKKKDSAFLDDTLITNKPDLFGVLIPNVWVVGFGLDHMQLLRGWTNLYACPKNDGVALSIDDNIFTDEKYYHTLRKKICLF